MCLNTNPDDIKNFRDVREKIFFEFYSLFEIRDPDKTFACLCCQSNDPSVYIQTLAHLVSIQTFLSAKPFNTTNVKKFNEHPTNQLGSNISLIIYDAATM